MATKKDFQGKQFTKQNLGEMTMKELTALHTSLVPGGTHAFKDKTSAVNAVWEAGGEVAQETAPAEGKPEKAPKEKKPREPKEKVEVFDLPIAVGLEAKMCAAGTGTEALAVALARPEGATFQECIEAVSKTKDHTATRNDIVGGIRWLNKGMNYGIKSDDRKAMHLVDADGNKVGYKPREVESAEAKEARKAAKEAERLAKKEQKDKEKAEKKAAKDAAAKAAAESQPAPAN